MQLIGGGRDSAGGDTEFSGGASGSSGSRRDSSAGGAPANKSGPAKKNVDDFDDDIPFCAESSNRSGLTKAGGGTRTALLQASSFLQRMIVAVIAATSS